MHGGWPGDNLDVDPGFAAPPASPTHQGQWEETAVDDHLSFTVLTDADASWAPHTLGGRIIAINASQPRWAVVYDNTDTQIILRGFAAFPVVNTGDTYKLLDLRLGATSPCIDAGRGDADTPALDLAGLPRQDLGQSAAHGGVGSPNYVDIGAHERQP